MSKEGSVRADGGNPEGDEQKGITKKKRGKKARDVITGHEYNVETMKVRQLVYPKMTLSFGLQCDRNLICYLKVSTQVKDELIVAGYTETISYQQLEYTAFSKSLDITYRAGVDDNQMLIIDIMDGDYLRIQQGFQFVTLVARVSELNKDIIRLPICTGGSEVGELIIKVDMGVESESVSIEEKDKIKVGFFKTPRPTIDSLRELYPFFREEFTYYSFQLKTKKCVLPRSYSAFGESGYTQMKICISHGKKNDSASRHLKQIWESMRVRKAPFDIISLDIKLSHELLTGSFDLTKHFDPSTRLVFQIWAGGTGSSPDEPEILLRYTTIRLKKLIKKAAHGGGKFHRCLVRVFDLENTADKGKKDEKAGDKEEGGKGNSRDSFDDEIDQLCVFKESGPQDEETGDDGTAIGDEEDVGGGASKSSKKRNQLPSKAEVAASAFEGSEYGDKNKALKAVSGELEVKIKRELINVEVSLGDETYDRRIKNMFKQRTAEWANAMRRPFFEAWSDQSQTTLITTNILEMTMQGWVFDTTLVVDVQPSCINSLSFQLDPKNSETVQTESTFIDSNVYNALKSIYNFINPFTDNGKVKVIAGGGVGAPQLEHPSSGLTRTMGFPLCQEILLNKMKDVHSFKSLKERLLKPLHEHDNLDELDIPFLQGESLDEILDYYDTNGDLIRVLEDPDSQWGGLDYANEKTYDSLQEVVQGMMEACTIYSPCLMTASEYAELYPPSRDSEVENVWVDPEDTCRMFKKSEMSTTKSQRSNSGMSEYGSKKKNMTRYLIGTVGTNFSKVKSGDDFWSMLPEELLSHDFKFSADIDAIESVLFQEQLPGESIKLVVWIVGQCPPPPVLKRFERMIKRHVITDCTVGLMIYLAAETSVEHVGGDPDTIVNCAEPFVDLIDAYNRAYNEAVDIFHELNPDVHLRKHHSFKWDEHSSKYEHKQKLCHRLTKHLMLFHGLTFAELILRVFLKMDMNNEEQATARSETAGSSYGDAGTNKMPSLQDVKEILSLYFKGTTLDRILGMEEEGDSQHHDMLKALSDSTIIRSDRLLQEKEGSVSEMESVSNKSKSDKEPKKKLSFFDRLRGKKPAAADASTAAAPSAGAAVTGEGNAGSPPSKKSPESELLKKQKAESEHQQELQRARELYQIQLKRQMKMIEPLEGYETIKSMRLRFDTEIHNVFIKEFRLFLCSHAVSMKCYVILYICYLSSRM